MANRLGLWLRAIPTRIKQSTSELLESPALWHRRRALRLRTFVFLWLLLVITVVASVHLYVLSTERAKEIRRELFQRDLRDLVGRFDADERFVLESNIPELITERRTLRPLLLPRPYYTGLPSSLGPVLPRQPPRNCFVYLDPKDGSTPSENDRFCSYFGESSSPGRYLYLAATFAEEEVFPLRQGDTKLAADAIRVEMTVRGKIVTWWLAFQLPPVPSRTDRFELTAFRQVKENQRDLDRKIEGWAYLQKQAKTARLHLIARLDYREFIDPIPSDDWPPHGWQDTTFSIARKDVSGKPIQLKLVEYRSTGRSELSLSGMGAQIFNAYGNISLRKVEDDSSEEWSISPPSNLEGKLVPGVLGIKVSNGDLLIPAVPTSELESVPDTDLFVLVSHPWQLIEKGFWQISLYFLALLIVGAFTIRYFSKNLLTPIGHWARHSERLVQVRQDSDAVLPYSERNNEIGELAGAINALIRSVRDQMAMAQAEREVQQAEARRKRDEEVENRVQNLKVMGHEIRSPLQALMGLHPDPYDKSRRYIDRMLAALPHLLGGESAIDAIGARELEIETFDLANFLYTVAQNAQQADILGVQYNDRTEGIYCRGDVGAFEDALTNVLNNAKRYRRAGTPILLLLDEGDTAGVEVWNDGVQITEENLARIFDFGFSTEKKTAAQGLGVGMFVARDYLRRMNGAIKVRNHDKGVVFTLTLPNVHT